jgi:hypothetical protein
VTALEHSEQAAHRSGGIGTRYGDESWLEKFEHRDKWSFWLAASKIAVEQERR